MANQKREKLSAEIAAQGYHCHCGQSEHVLLLYCLFIIAVSSALLVLFHLNLFLCAVSFLSALSHLLMFNPLLCLPFSLHLLLSSICISLTSLSLSPRHLNFSVALHSLVCRDCLSLIQFLSLPARLSALTSIIIFTFLFLSLSKPFKGRL